MEGRAVVNTPGWRRPRALVAACALSVGAAFAVVIFVFLAGDARLKITGSEAHLTVEQGMGPRPILPNPDQALVPVINVGTAVGWPDGRMPSASEGLAVQPFAKGLNHPRWIHVLPNGDVLVAETNAPPRPEDSKGIRGWLFGYFQKKGGGGSPTANRITLLRDVDGDGVAEVSSVFLSGLNSPFGMTLIGDTLYVANTDALMAFPYVAGSDHIEAAGRKVIDLPAGPLNHHWTKNVIASPDGTKLYVAIGSNSNAGENGIDQEVDRAQIWEVDVATGSHRVFASGLRNPVGMDFEPTSGTLWTSVNERDELGSDLVPDYLTSVRDRGFYGFPYSYFGTHVDQRVKPQRPDLVAEALVPDYALGPHTASLGLAFAKDMTLPSQFQSGAFIGQHGSWNRKPRSGYKVIFVPFVDGAPSGDPVTVLDDFVDKDGRVMGRPVGVAVDKKGALLVADDAGNTIWRVRRQAS